jgi:hypothetical protein
MNGPAARQPGVRDNQMHYEFPTPEDITP